MSIATSIMRALRMRTSILRRASRAGGRTAATSILRTASRTISTRIPAAAAIERPMEEGGGNTSTFPFEIWHYRYLEGIGDNIDIEFVDTCMCGDYHMTIDRSEKDALKHVPGAGLTHVRADGQSDKKDRFSARGAGAAWAGPMTPAEPEQAVRPAGSGCEDDGAAADQVQGPGSSSWRARRS